MGRHAKTQRIIDEAHAILAAFHPMTVRQVFYQLVSRHVIENNRSRYEAVSDALVAARREGIIPWEWIEDRLRRPRRVSMWNDLADYAESIRHWYRRDVWATQPRRLEVWLEKDALSGIFSDALSDYGVTFNVGRGYDSWSSIRNAAERFGDGDDMTVLYFGDFDPSGEDMVRSFRERLASLDCHPEVVKIALTVEDIEQYNLPPDFTKTTDSRRQKHIDRFGDLSVELDALPANVLRDRLVAEVEARMDLDALTSVRTQEEWERRMLVEALRTISE